MKWNQPRQGRGQSQRGLPVRDTPCQPRRSGSHLHIPKASCMTVDCTGISSHASGVANASTQASPTLGRANRDSPPNLGLSLHVFLTAYMCHTYSPGHPLENLWSPSCISHPSKLPEARGCVLVTLPAQVTGKCQVHNQYVLSAECEMKWQNGDAILIALGCTQV